jgi:hypothetical protein
MELGRNAEALVFTAIPLLHNFMNIWVHEDV